MDTFSLDDQLFIGSPKYTSTPLPKRKLPVPLCLPTLNPTPTEKVPTPLTRPSLSAGPTEQVPTLSATHPMASPTFLQTSYYPSQYTFFPQPNWALCYSQSFPHGSYHGYSLPPGPTYLTQASSLQSTSPVLQPPAVPQTVPTSPVSETRPTDFLLLPDCFKPDIGQAIDDLISQVLVSESTRPALSTVDPQTALETRLLAMESRFPSEVRDLLSFIRFHCSAIEQEKQQCLSDGLFPTDYNTWLSQRYAEQLQLVFSSVEKNLQVLERQSKNSRVQKRTQCRGLNPEALTLMENWYQQHLTKPYPTQTEAEEMAIAGGITVAQLRKWFSNKRSRSRRPRTDQKTRPCTDLVAPQPGLCGSWSTFQCLNN